MATSPTSRASEPPAAFVNERREGWHAFTRAIVIQSVAVAVFLLVMLLVFKVF
jgi:hypothetical protein